MEWKIVMVTWAYGLEAALHARLSDRELCAPHVFTS